jgi:(1->4)-alpha-D-glucan 1-alpha-D-glucosylmutase
VVSRALRLRRDRPELLQAYEPVHAVGPQADHLIGFDRGGAVALATRLPLGLEAAGGWGGTAVEVTGRDELTGREFDGPTPVAELFGRYPVALVVTR